MNQITKFITNHSTNIVATAYVMLVQIPTLVLEVIQVWIPEKKWPTETIVKIKKLVDKLIKFGK